MKKRVNLLVLICLAVFTLNSCVENEPDIVDLPSKDVDFYYTSQTINYVILEQISFVNTSTIGSSYEWEFGDGKKSIEKDPVHQYEEPGNYMVKLKVDGTYSTSKKLLISDIVPKITVTNGEKAVYKQTRVTLTPYVDNPEKADVTYNWTFPKGTQGEGIDAEGRISLKDDTPVNAVFNQFGTLNVTLQVNLGEKSLDPIIQKVNINYDRPAKTLYYAVKGGNIMAKKLVDDVDDEINQPFDTQYKSGKHSLTLLYSNDLLYVFDAGTKTGYVEDPAGLGDGEIFTINPDWNRRETIIENKGGDSYLDFFYGYIDEEQGRLHFADRREGIRWIPLTTRNAKFDEDIYTYWVQNNRLGYYGNGISYGATNGPFFKRNGVWHWGKNSLVRGIYRFTEADVDKTTIPSEGAITNYSVRGMAMDETNNLIYLSNSMGSPMVVAVNLETGTLVSIMDQSPTDSEGGASEPLYVTGITFDEEYVYWAYRGDASSVDDNGQLLNPSGIKRVKISDVLEGGYVMDKVDFLVPDVNVYGITIDHTLR